MQESKGNIKQQNNRQQQHQLQ